MLLGWSWEGWVQFFGWFKHTTLLKFKMPTASVNITRNQYEQMMLDLNTILQRLIVDDTDEYEYLGIVVNGLTPRMKVNLYEHINITIRNLLNNEHPMIVKKITHNIMLSLDSAIYALLSIRDKNTFTPLEIKTYLYNYLEWLLDIETHYPSLIGDYVNITESESNIIEENDE